jgi:mono/diheme cytochrome c family protein
MSQMLKMLAAATLLLTVMLAGTRAAQAQSVAQPATGDAAKGKARFAEVGCYQCHGFVGQGGAGARLAPNPIPFPAFQSYIRSPKGQMPPYTSKYLTDQDLADLYAYLQSVPKPPDWKTVPELKD